MLATTVRSVTQRWRALRAFVRRISPRARDILAILISLAAGIGYALTVEAKGSSAWMFTVLGLCAVGSLTLWWRRQHPVLITGLGLGLQIVTAFPAVVAFGIVTLAVRRRDRVLVAIVALTYATDVVRSIITGGFWLTTLITSLLFWSALVAIGAYVGARRDLVDSLRQRAETAEGERELRADQARLAERNRIAREMHDVLAHKVSLIALHAGGLEVRPDAGPDQVERTAALVRSTAREALEDLRRVLGVLRTDEAAADLAPQPGLDQVTQLVESSRAAGIAIDLDWAVLGEPPDVVGRTAYRVVQEALTNVHKHARSATTTVRLRRGPGGRLEVEVRNLAPVAAATLLPGAGMGLVGLAERVALVGGVLQSGRTDDGGWLVCAHLPWPASDAASASASDVESESNEP